MQLFDLLVRQSHRLHHSEIAGSGRLAVDQRPNTLAGDVLELINGLDLGILFLTIAHDRFRQRMLGHRFQGNGGVQQRGFAFAQNRDLGDFRLAGCDRAGFIQNDGL